MLCFGYTVLAVLIESLQSNAIGKYFKIVLARKDKIMLNFLPVGRLKWITTPTPASL